MSAGDSERCTRSRRGKRRGAAVAGEHVPPHLFASHVNRRAAARGAGEVLDLATQPARRDACPQHTRKFQPGMFCKRRDARPGRALPGVEMRLQVAI